MADIESSNIQQDLPYCVEVSVVRQDNNTIDPIELSNVQTQNESNTPPPEYEQIIIRNLPLERKLMIVGDILIVHYILIFLILTIYATVFYNVTILSCAIIFRFLYLVIYCPIVIVHHYDYIYKNKNKMRHAWLFRCVIPIIMTFGGIVTIIQYGIDNDEYDIFVHFLFVHFIMSGFLETVFFCAK